MEFDEEDEESSSEVTVDASTQNTIEESSQFFNEF